MLVSEVVSQRNALDFSQKDLEGVIFDIDRYAIHDGPGIRLLVFMKGCPLRCSWCCNPEGQNFSPEVAYFPAKCIGCGACIEVCPEKALRFQEGKLVTNWRICRHCGRCVDRCYADARKLFGRTITVSALMEEVFKSIAFLTNSGGGITVGGGELTGQATFVSNFLRSCKKEGLHTAIETCGYCTWGALSKVLEYADLVFYDVKHMNSKKHKTATGVPNRRILENLKKVSTRPVDLVVRVPVIPEFNDDEENLSLMAEFIVSQLNLSRFQMVELLPYHKLGAFKYERLGRVYDLKSLEPPSDGKLHILRKIIESYNIVCHVGGLNARS